jgi:hypothetical protein|tara:strand:- start:47 stop:382 length:336 start_codon:yes stop_codon:yes gene_type:complete
MEEASEELAEMVLELELMVSTFKSLAISGKLKAMSWNEVEVDGERVGVAELDVDGRDFLFVIGEHEEEGVTCSLVSKKFSDLQVYVPAPSELIHEPSNKVIGTPSFKDDWR